MNNQLRGCVKVSANGKQLYRFINLIHDSRICCFGQFCRRDVFYCEIYRHDLTTLRSLAESCDITLKTTEYRTISSIFLRYRRRFGVLIGLLLVLTAWVYFSSTVVTIDIRGNSAVSDEEILAALDSVGIRRGVRINSLNLHWCENQFRIISSGISWAGIRRSGNRIVVEVTEPTPAPQMINKRTPCNIVATHDARITSVSVLDGQLMQIVGTKVAAGDTLISGVITDSKGRTALHHARGSIRGVYTDRVTFTAPRTLIKYVPTGNCKNMRTLRLFSLDIPLYFGKNKFNSYTPQTSYSPLSIFGKTLPLGIENCSLTETALSEMSFTDEQLISQLREKVYIYEKNFIQTDTKIIRREVEEFADGDAMCCIVTYQLEGEIGAEHSLEPSLSE